MNGCSRRHQTRTRFSWAVFILFSCLIWTVQTSVAQAFTVVALGASNTAGKGVGEEAAWPAQLEGLLRGRGLDVRVINAGINGDTTADMLARLNEAVPDGTNLVILDKAPANDQRSGVNSAANVAAIKSQLRARGIKLFIIPAMHQWGDQLLQPDGIHLTAEGHRRVAERLLPIVLSALGKAK